jgi:hypothetical protein
VSSEDLDSLLARLGQEEHDDTDERRGQAILDAVEASAKAAEKPHPPIVAAIARAYQARASESSAEAKE